ncbi:MAG TPA: P-loop NTPase [Actinomycetota bacterium]|nr:P-loop NTPase [Actinomycetota bacterium]
MIATRVVTVAGDPDAEARLTTAFGARHDVDVVFRCVDRVELLAALRGAAPDLVVVVGCPVWLDRQSCDEAVTAGVPVVGLAGGADQAEALAQLGILALPLDAEPERILDVRASKDALPQAPAALARTIGPRGRVIAVWGPKGAPGRSTVAVEIAAELAASERETALVDADTYGGDLAQMLGVVEELPTLVWACHTAAHSDGDPDRLLRGLRRIGDSGPVLVPGIPRADLWRDVGEFAWRELLAALRERFESVVVDAGFCLEDDSAAYAVGEGRNAIARQLLRTADSVVAVCRCDPVGLKTFLWTYSGLTELVEEDRVFVVANRVTSGDETAVAELLRRHTGKRPVAYVPDDPGLLRAAAAKGVSAREHAPSSGVSRALTAVAAGLGAKPRPAGVFARLAGRA